MDRRGQPYADCAEPVERVAAFQTERLDVDLDEVRLDLLELDRDAGRVERLGEPTRARVVVGEPVDVVVERVQARRGDDPRLTHGPAEQVLLAPRALHELA